MIVNQNARGEEDDGSSWSKTSTRLSSQIPQKNPGKQKKKKKKKKRRKKEKERIDRIDINKMHVTGATRSESIGSSVSGGSSTSGPAQSGPQHNVFIDVPGNEQSVGSN